MTKQTFNPSVPEDLNRPYNVTLTEGQIATILYVMEGYIQGNDEYEDSFKVDVDNIFEVLEGAVDNYYDAKEVEECIADGTDYSECVDALVDRMDKLETAKRVAGVEETNRFLSALEDNNPYKNIPDRY